MLHGHPWPPLASPARGDSGRRPQEQLGLLCLWPQRRGPDGDGEAGLARPGGEQDGQLTVSPAGPGVSGGASAGSSSELGNLGS